MLTTECEYILEVCQKGSFSRAAESLHITQPSLSVAVKRFENKMGFSVFDRSKFPLQLTPEGERCIQTIKEMIRLKHEMLQYIEAQNSKKTGKLRIISTGYYCAYLLPGILEAFRKKYPKYTVTLDEVDAKNMQQQFESQEIDVCIAAKKFADERYNIQTLFRETLVLAVPASFEINETLKEHRLTFEQMLNEEYRDANKPAVPAKHFRDIPFLMLQEYNDTSDRILKICEEADFTPRIAMRLDQMLTTFYVAAAGVGAAFVRTALICNVEPTGKLFFYMIEDPKMTRPVMLYYRKDKSKTEIIKDFIRFFEEAFRG